MNIGPTTRVFLALGSTDMRKSFDGLFALVRGAMELDPMSGHLHVFCNRPRNRLKVLYWDGSGLWVCAKRLEKGRFAWPDAASAENGKVALTAAQWTMLVEGIDLKNTRGRRWHRVAPGIVEENHMKTAAA